MPFVDLIESPRCLTPAPILAVTRLGPYAGPSSIAISRFSVSFVQPIAAARAVASALPQGAESHLVQPRLPSNAKATARRAAGAKLRALLSEESLRVCSDRRHKCTQSQQVRH